MSFRPSSDVGVDPLDINPVEYIRSKQILRAKFISYIPPDIDAVTNMILLERIFNQLVVLNPDFDQIDVEESVRRIIKT